MILTREAMNVLTLRRVSVIIFAVEKTVSIIYYVSVCSLRYSARNTHAPYSHLWPVQLYNIFFSNYLINVTTFRKKIY